MEAGGSWGLVVPSLGAASLCRDPTELASLAELPMTALRMLGVVGATAVVVGRNSRSSVPRAVESAFDPAAGIMGGRHWCCQRHRIHISAIGRAFYYLGSVPVSI